MSMSGLRRPRYAALVVAATIGIAFLAYHNYRQVQDKPTNARLHRSNAVRRSPRRRPRHIDPETGLPYVDEAVSSYILELVDSDRVVGLYRNEPLWRLVSLRPEVSLDLTCTNRQTIHQEIILRSRALSLEWPPKLQQDLKEHIDSQFTYYAAKEFCDDVTEMTEPRFEALIAAFANLAIGEAVARKAVDLAATGQGLMNNLERWHPESVSTDIQIEQRDGAADESGPHPSTANPEVTQQEEATPFPHGEFEHSGGSPNMLSVLYSISREQTRREAYIHRGIECNSCGVCPIEGIRYHCSNCFDYDLCETCEASLLHCKTHVFYKIRIPAPHRGQIKQVLPKWYPGNPNAFPQNLPKHVSDRLKDQCGIDIPEIEAQFDQFKCIAGARLPNDPCELGMAIDRKAFDLYFLPGPSDKPSPSNLIYDRIFSFYDRNDDGLIGFEDFLMGLTALQNKSRMARLSRIFQGYDLDADGYVCRKDFLRIFRAYYDLSRQFNREMLANQEELGYIDEEIREVVGGSQPLSAAFLGTTFYGHQSRTGQDKQVSANGDLLLVSGPNEVLQQDQDLHGDRARAIGNAAIGNRPRPHPFRSFRTDPPSDEPLIQLPMRNSFELLGIQHADDATEDDLTGPEPPHQSYGWPPLLSPEPQDIVDALGVEVPIEEINDPLDRSRVIYAQSQRLDVESDDFLDWTRKNAVHNRWRRREFYIDKEEGLTKPQGFTGADSSDEESEGPQPKTTSSSRRQSLRSRSSSKVRFDDSAIDTDYDTKSNASSRSFPQNERWGGYELSHPEIEVGQDILYEAVQQGVNELLDKLFKEKEDAAMNAKSSRKSRDLWRHAFEQHKQAVLEEVETVEKLLIDADQQRTEELLRGSQSLFRSAQTPSGGTPSEISAGGPAEAAQIPTDRVSLARQTYGSQIEVGIAEALSEVKLASALAVVGYGNIHREKDALDPTLPQNMRNEWDPIFNRSQLPKGGFRPSKEVLNQWILHEATEVESEARGGPGKLTFEEFRWKMRKEDEVAEALGDDKKTQEHGYWEESADLGKLSFVGTWLEMASF